MSKRNKSGNATAKIEYDKKDNRSLFLGKFANGLVKDEHRGDVHGKHLTHKNRTDLRTKNNKTVVMESSAMTYIGKNHGPTSLNSVKGTLRQYVGIYDEKSGKMRVCDAEMFHMVPFIPGLDKVDAAAPDKEKTYVEKFGSLVEAFGSKKKKQSFEKKHRNKMDSTEMEGVMAADARHGQEQVRSRHEEKERLAEQIDSLGALPPCNKDAENVEDVYTLDTVITQPELDMLQNLAQEFFNCTADNIREWREKKQYPLYVLTHLATMPVDEGLRWHRSKLLLYLHYMLSLYNMPPSQLKQPKSFSELPQTIRHKLFDNFTVRVRQLRCKPTRLKDRLAAFVIVLCLHIDEFSTDIDDITCDLRIGRHKATQILRALGCQVKRNIKDKAEHFVGTLALPLQFPTEASKGGNRRR